MYLLISTPQLRDRDQHCIHVLVVSQEHPGDLEEVLGTAVHLDLKELVSQAEVLEGLEVEQEQKLRA